MAGRPRLAKLRSEALDLPQSERAELVCDLMASLDGPPDADMAQAWDAEIEQRLAEINAGTAELIDRDEFRRRMRTLLDH